VSALNKYILEVAYDGFAYQGWQIQKHTHETVAGVMIAAFKEAFFTEVHLLGASRTDAGVHALGQVVLVETSLLIDPTTLKEAWNSRLPYDIVIRRAAVAPHNFHPLAGVTQKTYFYHFFRNEPLPFISRYGWWCKRPLDLEVFKECLSIFKGTHDFRSFCTGHEQTSTIRTIDNIEVVYLKQMRTFRIIIQAKGFLRYMIRRIVGASFQIVLTQKPPQHLRHILEQKNPRQQLGIAAPHGLLLRRIHYERTLW